MVLIKPDKIVKMGLKQNNKIRKIFKTNIITKIPTGTVTITTIIIITFLIVFAQFSGSNFKSDEKISLKIPEPSFVAFIRFYNWFVYDSIILLRLLISDF